MKDKIEKLLRLAANSGANESEANNAMALAAALAAKAGIDLASIDINSPELKAIRGKWSKNAADKKWKVELACAVGYLYFSRVITNSLDELQFVGRPEILESAYYTHNWLIEQVEALYKQNLPRGLTVKARAEYRRTFKQACAMRIRRRAWEIIQALQNNDTLALEATGHHALVVKNSYLQAMDAAQEAMGKGVRQSKTRPSSVGSGSTAGHLAGDRVQLQHAAKSHSTLAISHEN